MTLRYSVHGAYLCVEHTTESDLELRSVVHIEMHLRIYSRKCDLDA